MKQKFFVLGCSNHDLADLRQRLGSDHDVVECQSWGELEKLYHSPDEPAVLAKAVATMESPSMDVEPWSPLSHEVGAIVREVLEPANGHARSLAARVDLLERKIIEHCLSRNRQHRKETAAELGISRVTLYNKMKKFGLLNS